MTPGVEGVPLLLLLHLLLLLERRFHLMSSLRFRWNLGATDHIGRLARKERRGEGKADDGGRCRELSMYIWSGGWTVAAVGCEKTERERES